MSRALAVVEGLIPVCVRGRHAGAVHALRGVGLIPRVRGDMKSSVASSS
jgi:hypothetical protein